MQEVTLKLRKDDAEAVVKHYVSQAKALKERRENVWESATSDSAEGAINALTKKIAQCRRISAAARFAIEEEG